MSEDNIVEIKIVASGTNEAAQDINKVGAAAQGMGSEAGAGFEQGRIGALGFKVGAHELLGELGIHGPMMRSLSHEAANFAETLGTGAMVLGVVGVAALATYKIYEHFAEETKKTREELDKSVHSLESEVKALYDNGLQTNEVTKAHEGLLKTKRDIYLIDAPQRIRNEKKELEELNKKQQEGLGFFEKLAIAWETRGGSMLAVEAKMQLALTENNLKLIEAIHLKQDSIKDDQAMLKAIQEGGPTKRQAAESEARRKAAEEEEKIHIKSLQNMRAYTTAAVAEHQKRLADEVKNAEQISKVMEQAENKRNLIGLKGFQKQMTQMAQEHKKELADLKKLTSDKIMIAQLEAVQEMAWRDEVTKHEEELMQKRLDAAIGAYQNMTGALHMMYQQQGEEHSAAHAAYKLMAKGEIAVNTAKAAMGAYSALSGITIVGPVLGALAAAAAIAYGAQQMSAVDHEAGGTAPTASTGTYPVSPVTGLPPVTRTRPVPAAQSVIVNFYGTVASDQELARKMAQEIPKAISDGVGGSPASDMR